MYIHIVTRKIIIEKDSNQLQSTNKKKEKITNHDPNQGHPAPKEKKKITEWHSNQGPLALYKCSFVSFFRSLVLLTTLNRAHSGSSQLYWKNNTSLNHTAS